MPEPFTIISIIGISVSISKLLYSVTKEVKFQVMNNNKNKVKNIYMIDVDNINNETCTICLEIPKECIQLKCGHIFHKDCINKWFPSKKTCPNCRRLLITI